LKISVIVPAYNEERLLGLTLSQLRQAMGAFSARNWESELIVCDNNSIDRTAELARAAGATVVFEPINQIARARNCGAAAATGDWLLFVDADSQPCPGLFEDVVEQIHSGDCIAGGCTIRIDDPHPTAKRIARSWNWISRSFRLMAGSFIFCQAEAFRKIGGFNQELFVTEELDLSKRLKQLARKSGKRIVILHRYPLVTSARKFHLYSVRELFVFIVR